MSEKAKITEKLKMSEEHRNIMLFLTEMKDNYFKVIGECFSKIKCLQDENKKLSDRICVLENIHNLPKYQDSCTKYKAVESEENEVIISGIPNVISDEPSTVAKKVFKFLDTSNTSFNNVTARIVRRNFPVNSEEFQNSKVNNNTYSIIATLSNKTEVNNVIKMKCCNRHLNSSDIFSDLPANSSIINVNRVYSPFLYKLFLKTRVVASAKGYPMPRIKNNIIYLSKNNSVPPDIIHNELDLLILQELKK